MSGSLVLTKDLQAQFLALYRETGLLGRSAEGIAVSPSTIRKVRKEDPDFDAAVEHAYDQFRESLEAEAYRRAVTGWTEDVFQRGQCVGSKTVRSDRMLELVLKRHIPAYRERQSLDVNVTGGVLVVPGTKETLDEWERRNRSASALDAASGGPQLLPGDTSP